MVSNTRGLVVNRLMRNSGNCKHVCLRFGYSYLYARLLTEKTSLLKHPVTLKNNKEHLTTLLQPDIYRLH